MFTNFTVSVIGLDGKIETQINHANPTSSFLDIADILLTNFSSVNQTRNYMSHVKDVKSFNSLLNYLDAIKSISSEYDFLQLFDESGNASWYWVSNESFKKIINDASMCGRILSPLILNCADFNSVSLKQIQHQRIEMAVEYLNTIIDQYGLLEDSNNQNQRPQIDFSNHKINVTLYDKQLYRTFHFSIKFDANSVDFDFMLPVVSKILNLINQEFDKKLKFTSKDIIHLQELADIEMDIENESKNMTQSKRAFNYLVSLCRSKLSINNNFYITVDQLKKDKANLPDKLVKFVEDDFSSTSISDEQVVRYVVGSSNSLNDESAFNQFKNLGNSLNRLNLQDSRRNSYLYKTFKQLHDRLATAMTLRKINQAKKFSEYQHFFEPSIEK